MLLIQRRKGEAIHVGDGIEIRVAAIGRSRVTLAITAPGDVPVVRAEVRIAAQQNRAAVGAAASAISDMLRRFRQDAGVSPGQTLGIRTITGDEEETGP